MSGIIPLDFGVDIFGVSSYHLILEEALNYSRAGSVWIMVFFRFSLPSSW
jgi:hypothetical protein